MPRDRELVALISIGSNSVRLLIGERGDRRISAVERGEVVTKLAGYKVMADGRFLLTPDAIRDTLQAAGNFARRTREQGATLLGVVATEAVRTADNSLELTERLERDLGVSVRIITGEDEAELGWLAVASIPQVGGGAVEGVPLGVIDIGGGSTDLSVGYAGQSKPKSVVSLQAGSRTAMSRFSLDRPIERTKLMGVMSALNIELARRAEALRPKPQVAVVMGGTGSVIALLRGDPPDGDAPIDALWLDKQLKEMSLLGQEGRVARGVPQDRADVVVAGAAILLTLLQAWGLPNFQVSERNILDGYLQKVL